MALVEFELVKFYILTYVIFEMKKGHLYPTRYCVAFSLSIQYEGLISPVSVFFSYFFLRSLIIKMHFSHDAGGWCMKNDTSFPHKTHMEIMIS